MICCTVDNLLSVPLVSLCLFSELNSSGLVESSLGIVLANGPGEGMVHYTLFGGWLKTGRDGRGTVRKSFNRFSNLAKSGVDDFLVGEYGAASQHYL